MNTLATFCVEFLGLGLLKVEDMFKKLFYKNVDFDLEIMKRHAIHAFN